MEERRKHKRLDLEVMVELVFQMLLLPASLCGNGVSEQRGSSDESFGWDFFV